MGNFRDNYEIPSDKEVEYAHEVAEKLTEPEEEKEIRLVKGGRKRQDYGSSKLPLLTGCTKAESELIRILVGHKFSGYTQIDAFELEKVNPSATRSMIDRRDGAWQEAIQDHLSRCIREYQNNLWMLKSALSEMGSRAVRTLGAVMDDPKASGHVRMKAAVSILKLINIDGGASNGKDSDMPSEFLITLKDNRTGIESDSVYIVDADGVEVLGDEDADRNECSPRVC